MLNQHNNNFIRFNTNSMLNTSEELKNIKQEVKNQSLIDFENKIYLV